MLELRIPPLALVVIVAAAMWATAAMLPAAALDVPQRAWLAALCAATGLGFALVGVLAFRRAHTTVDPTRPDSASTIVSSGVYRVSRNPMYVGFLLVLAGLGLWLANFVALLWLPVFVIYMTRFQIIPEECALQARFGAPYAAYRRQVRRWL